MARQDGAYENITEEEKQEMQRCLIEFRKLKQTAAKGDNRKEAHDVANTLKSIDQEVWNFKCFIGYMHSQLESSKISADDRRFRAYVLRSSVPRLKRSRHHFTLMISVQVFAKTLSVIV